MRIAQRSNLCVSELAHQRAHARARLLRWLDSNRMRAWVEHWLEQLRLGTASSARARQAITAKVARDLIRATARKLRKRADAIDETSGAEAFHEVRIRAKRLRYALDAFGSLYGDAAREYLDALARLQHVLGEFHDSAVRTEMFAKLVTHGPARAGRHFLPRRSARGTRSAEFRKVPTQIREGVPHESGERRWRALSEAMREQESNVSPAPVGAVSALMNVYLVRHAIAHERSRARWPNDAMRPLTAAGKQRFRKAARGLARLLPKSALLLTSPFVRARDTALILARVAKLRSPVEAPELASGKPAREAFELLRSRKKAAIVLVGHEPNLSIFLSAALAEDRASLKIAVQERRRRVCGVRRRHSTRPRHAQVADAAARVAGSQTLTFSP